MQSKNSTCLVKACNLILACLLFPFLGFSQPTNDSVFSKSIQTVLFYQTGLINTIPVIDFNDPDSRLTLSFDDMTAQQQDMEYKIVHCDANWKIDNLLESDYLDGNTYSTIDNYSFSFNTYVDFVNYWCFVPGENVYIKLPGNYILYVYPEGEENQILLRRRFYVANNKVIISASVDRPTYARYSNTHQELDFEIDVAGLDVRNPMSDVIVNIRQNQRWDNMKYLRPRYINGTLLDYNYEEENLFMGESEWRKVDMRSVRYPRYGVGKINLDTLYHLYLMNDEDRSIVTYGQWKDINGNRVVAGDRKDLKPHELDYVVAHFRLKTPFPVDDTPVYLFGSFTDWKLKDAYKMHYDIKNKLYRGNVLLKQGYYNFYYAVSGKGGQVDCSRFQGSHYETENDYYIFVYLYSFVYQTDLLVGYQVVTSVKE